VNQVTSSWTENAWFPGSCNLPPQTPYNHVARPPVAPRNSSVTNSKGRRVDRQLYMSPQPGHLDMELLASQVQPSSGLSVPPATAQHALPGASCVSSVAFPTPPFSAGLFSPKASADLSPTMSAPQHPSLAYLSADVHNCFLFSIVMLVTLRFHPQQINRAGSSLTREQLNYNIAAISNIIESFGHASPPTPAGSADVVPSPVAQPGSLAAADRVTLSSAAVDPHVSGATSSRRRDAICLYGTCLSPSHSFSARRPVHGSSQGGRAVGPGRGSRRRRWLGEPPVLGGPGRLGARRRSAQRRRRPLVDGRHLLVAAPLGLRVPRAQQPAPVRRRNGWAASRVVARASFTFDTQTTVEPSLSAAHQTVSRAAATNSAKIASSMTPKLKEKLRRKECELAEIDRDFARHFNAVAAEKERVCRLQPIFTGDSLSLDALATEIDLAPPACFYVSSRVGLQVVNKLGFSIAFAELPAVIARRLLTALLMLSWRWSRTLSCTRRSPAASSTFSATCPADHPKPHLKQLSREKLQRWSNRHRLWVSRPAHQSGRLVGPSACPSTSSRFLQLPGMGCCDQSLFTQVQPISTCRLTDDGSSLISSPCSSATGADLSFSSGCAPKVVGSCLDDQKQKRRFLVFAGRSGWCEETRGCTLVAARARLSLQLYRRRTGWGRGTTRCPAQSGRAGPL